MKSRWRTATCTWNTPVVSPCSPFLQIRRDEQPRTSGLRESTRAIFKDLFHKPKPSETFLSLICLFHRPLLLWLPRTHRDIWLSEEDMTSLNSFRVFLAGIPGRDSSQTLNMESSLPTLITVQTGANMQHKNTNFTFLSRRYRTHQQIWLLAA